MTHLAAEIRVDALAVLEWLLEVAQEDVVSCPGGWVKTLKSFMSMMGWASSSGSSKWSSASKASFGKAGKTFPRQLLVLAQFLKAGLVDSEDIREVKIGGTFPLVDVERHMIPMRMKKERCILTGRIDKESFRSSSSQLWRWEWRMRRKRVGKLDELLRSWPRS